MALKRRKPKVGKRKDPLTTKSRKTRKSRKAITKMNVANPGSSTQSSDLYTPAELRVLQRGLEGKQNVSTVKKYRTAVSKRQKATGEKRTSSKQREKGLKKKGSKRVAVKR